MQISSVLLLGTHRSDHRSNLSITFRVATEFQTSFSKTFRLCFKLCKLYTKSVQFGSIWIASNLERVRLNCVGFIRARYHTATVQFRIGPLSPIWYRKGEPIWSGSARYRRNARLICASFVPVPNGSGPV